MQWRWAAAPSASRRRRWTATVAAAPRVSSPLGCSEQLANQSRDARRCHRSQRSLHGELQVLLDPAASCRLLQTREFVVARTRAGSGPGDTRCRRLKSRDVRLHSRAEALGGPRPPDIRRAVWASRVKTHTPHPADRFVLCHTVRGPDPLPGRSLEFTQRRPANARVPHHQKLRLAAPRVRARPSRRRRMMHLLAGRGQRAARSCAAASSTPSRVTLRSIRLPSASSCSSPRS